MVSLVHRCRSLNLCCPHERLLNRSKASALPGAGCDALSVHLAVTSIGTSIAVGFTKWTVLGVMSIMGPWLLAHWEEYHSGIMLYGNGYWGVTEANYLMVLLHFFTAAVGPGGHLPWTLHPVISLLPSTSAAISCMPMILCLDAAIKYSGRV